MPPQRRATRITADFPGAGCPTGSAVRFRGHDGLYVRGKVTRIRTHEADVLAEDGRQWSVPYRAIAEVMSSPPSDCSLREVEKLAAELLARHQGSGALPSGWSFGFDLAPSRAGVCRYREKRIDLSVSYCLAATRAEIADTILHEIAHAIVGPKHNHDAVWKAKAREIGCQGERCHRVQHSIPRWVGECGCGQQWFRQTLQRRMIRNRVCAKCRGEITWRRNTSPVL